jgi:hypothetical protein
MFKAMFFGFLVGVLASQQVQDWASDGTARVTTELHGLLSIDAYEKITAALR